MMVQRWDSAPAEQLSPLISRQMIHTDTMTFARLHLKKGAKVPMHSHHNEQISTMVSGRLRFVVGEEELILSAGESLVIPPNVPHEAEALDDCIAIDVFSPVREDWRSGDDSYLRK